MKLDAIGAQNGGMGTELFFISQTTYWNVGLINFFDLYNSIDITDEML